MFEPESEISRVDRDATPQQGRNISIKRHRPL